MLQEQRRKQLDSIVQQMVANRETDNDIRAVVNDFKTKYDVQEPSQQPQKERGFLMRTGEKVGEFLGEATGLTGTGKAIGSALFGGGAAGKITNKALDANKLVDEAKRLSSSDPRRRELLNQAMELSGKLGAKANELYESIPTERQAAGSMGKLALTAGTLFTPGAASVLGLTGKLAVATKIGEGGLIGATFKALENLEDDEKISKDIGKAALLGASIPAVTLAGTAIKKMAQATGQKIQYTVIKPSAADVRDGFKVETLGKHKITGSLGDMAHKVQDKLDDLGKELNSKVKREDIPVDLGKVYSQTIRKLTGNKTKAFGNIASTKRVLNNLENEIKEVTEDGIVNLADSQAIKQAAGLKGAWVYGSADPDATAVEKVYTAFYRELKEEIENLAPSGVKDINGQISELIPVLNAIIRRIPIAERNNLLSLTDVISAGFGAIHPSGLALAALNRLSKSARVGGFLSGVSAKQPTTNVGKRLFGF